MDIKAGKVYHEQLPADLLDRATKLFPRVQEFLSDYTLQKWVDGFRRDMHPEREIAAWERMMDHFDVLCKKRRAGTATERKEIFREAFEWASKDSPIVVSKGEVPTA